MAEKLLNAAGLSEFSKKIKEKAVFIKEEETSTPAILDLIYPVGSIYMSVNNVSPQTFIGGTWSQIQDTFLLAAGSTYTAGSTGGEATHKLTINEMPSHGHQAWHLGSTSGGSDGWVGTSGSHSGRETGPKGGDQPHNNMPPYLTVYMWKRTA